jgi:hypothetical protein
MVIGLCLVNVSGALASVLKEGQSTRHTGCKQALFPFTWLYCWRCTSKMAKTPNKAPFGRILGCASFTPHSLFVMHHFRKLSLYVRTGEFEDKIYIFHQQFE